MPVHLGWRLAFAAAVVVQLVVLYSPSGPGGPSVPGLDKVAHAFVFAAVGFTAVRQNWRPTPVLVVLLAHAGLSELVQHFFLAQRTGDPWDVLADAVGAVLAVLLGARTRVGAP